jgi:hypothetical protein
MALDKVKPLKIESSDTGGDENDAFPTSLNPEEDYVELAGIVIDELGVRDESTVVWRIGDDMMFRDTNNPGGATLTDLLASSGGGITEAQHRTLRQLIHFIDEGPAEGFASGAYKEILPSGDPFPTTVTWWESSAKLKKIIRKTITRSGGGATNVKPTPILWEIFDTDGSTMLASVSDAITYSGAFESTRTRTITVV